MLAVWSTHGRVHYSPVVDQVFPLQGCESILVRSTLSCLSMNLPPSTLPLTN